MGPTQKSQIVMPLDAKQKRDPPVEWNRGLLTSSCAASPWVLLLLVVMLAAHVRLGLDHWPRPMWETYESTALNLHLLAVWSLAWLFLFAAPPSWLILLCFRRFRLPLPVHLLQVIVQGRLDGYSFGRQVRSNSVYPVVPRLSGGTAVLRGRGDLATGFSIHTYSPAR